MKIFFHHFKTRMLAVMVLRLQNSKGEQVQYVALQFSEFITGFLNCDTNCHLKENFTFSEGCVR